MFRLSRTYNYLYFAAQNWRPDTKIILNGAYPKSQMSRRKNVKANEKIIIFFSHCARH